MAYRKGKMKSRDIFELFPFWKQLVPSSIYEDFLEVGYCDFSHSIATCANFAQVQMEDGDE